jgi:hypothetical protein
MNGVAALGGDAAARLVADLMPIAVAVSGEGAAGFAAALRAAGAEAEVFEGGPGGGPGCGGGAAFDLTVLLAGKEATHTAVTGPRVAALVAALANASDRLLFVPAPLSATGSAPEIGAWFELFAEHGFQPVVDYDAGFLGTGAFLVDRNATAADSDMAAFAARISRTGADGVEPESDADEAPPRRWAVSDPFIKDGAAEEVAALRAAAASHDADLAASRTEAQAWRARAAAASAEVDALKREMSAWDGLARWVWAVCTQSGRDTLSALRAAGGGPLGRRSWWQRWRRRPKRPTKAERVLLADAALVRGSRHFDAAWYIASHPELAERGDDPVWHYVLRGAAAGAEPGPYFDSAPWRARFPNRNPLAEAVRRGEA